MSENMKKLALYGLAILALGVAAGCANPTTLEPPAEVPDARVSPVVKKAQEFRAPSAAGVAIKDTTSTGGPLWVQLIHSRTFSSRPDPFALEPKEKGYEVEQTAQRIYGDVGFREDFVPQVEVVPVPEVEPQPHRRLAGVIVGDSVLALIDMGDGQLQLIRPGQEIDGWHVVSIDGDKATLRRSGNVLPHEVIVRLESPSEGFPTGGGTGNPGGGGGNGVPGRPGGLKGGEPGLGGGD